jgi:hypothetical protein
MPTASTIGRFGFDFERQVRLQQIRQDLLAGLNRSLGPAMLLRFERVHFHRHFGRRDQVGQEQKLPAAQLRAIAQVEIFGEGVVLPAARFVDARPAPQTGGAVEIKETTAAAAGGLLEEKVAVEEHRLDAGE